MVDEPEAPVDDTTEEIEVDDRAEAEASALAELALCENLSQTSGWAARWSTSMTGADAALLWAPDTVHPLFLCIGVSGAHSSVAFAPAIAALQRAAQPEVWERFSQSASSARAVTSASPPSSDSTGSSSGSSGWSATLS